jgi:hypothetical protein
MDTFRPLLLRTAACSCDGHYSFSWLEGGKSFKDSDSLG